MNKKKEVVVFVKNKLMSIDTVIPILVEIKEKFNISSIVVVFDELAHNGIKENVVINDAINYVGRELYVSRGSRNKITRKINIIVSLFILFLKFIQGCKILHFGALDEKPLKVIGVLFKKNIYLLQSDSFKHTYEDYNNIIGQKNKKYTTPVGDNMVAFSDIMPQLKIHGVDSKKIYHFGPTRTRKAWIDFSKRHSSHYFSTYHHDVDLSNGCIVLILSLFGTNKKGEGDGNSVTISLFCETIDILSNIGIPVLLKPHVFTDMKIVRNAISGKTGFYITYLHPTILSLKAKAFICNSYSTTMADAHSLGVTTIEYTDYPKSVLLATGYKSFGYQYIDYFINEDNKVFNETIKYVLLNKDVVNNYQGHDRDNSGLLYNLST